MIDLMVYIKQGVEGDEVWSLGVDELLEGDGASAEQREKLIGESVEAAHARGKLARLRGALPSLAQDTAQAMSQENVEVVRLASDAFNRGDIVAAMKDADPEAELDFSRALGPYRGVYQLDQIRGFLDDFTGNGLSE